MHSHRLRSLAIISIGQAKMTFCYFASSFVEFGTAALEGFFFLQHSTSQLSSDAIPDATLTLFKSLKLRCCRPAQENSSCISRFPDQLPISPPPLCVQKRSRNFEGRRRDSLLAVNLAGVEKGDPKLWGVKIKQMVMHGRRDQVPSAEQRLCLADKKRLQGS